MGGRSSSGRGRFFFYEVINDRNKKKERKTKQITRSLPSFRWSNIQATIRGRDRDIGEVLVENGVLDILTNHLAFLGFPFRLLIELTMMLGSSSWKIVNEAIFQIFLLETLLHRWLPSFGGETLCPRKLTDFVNPEDFISFNLLLGSLILAIRYSLIDSAWWHCIDSPVASETISDSVTIVSNCYQGSCYVRYLILFWPQNWTDSGVYLSQ